MTRRCLSAPTSARVCDAVDYARRWTNVDGQNQLAWLTLATVLERRGDVINARAAFMRGSEVSSWHEHIHDLARVLVLASPRDVSTRLRSVQLAYALSRAGAAANAINELSTLSRYCKQDGEIRTACVRFVTTIAHDADALTALTMVVRHAALAHMESTVVAGYQQESDAIHWAIEFIAPTIDLDRTGFNEDTLQRDNAKLEARIELGDRRACERGLLLRHISKSEAAARFVARLTPYQRKERTDMFASH